MGSFWARFFVTFWCLLFTAHTMADPSGYDIETAKLRCSKVSKNPKVLYRPDLNKALSPEDMAKKFSEIYQSGKRLSHHATFDAAQKQFLLYHNSVGGIKPVRISSFLYKDSLTK